MQIPDPVLTANLFADDRAALCALLDELTERDWAVPTACPGWSVRDVTLHMLGVDLANLSRRRDAFSGLSLRPGDTIVSFVNRINDEWLSAAQRISPRVTRDLLATLGPPLFEHFATLDQLALGDGVSWAGPDPAPVWLDVAREYTERWHHQQHIRDAVGRPGQTTRRFLYPVLATFAHALPLTLRDAEEPIGTVVQLRVTGEAGGDWSVRRDADRWRLYVGTSDAPAAQVTLDQRTAWRLYTKGITPAEARKVSLLEGNRTIAERLLNAVAIIA